ncbi:MAG: hypothetical protein CMK32_08880 [Porticoccaceae bacterium]|nr:hypothetical protein [Porticoccaceae bacterium]
MIRNIGVVILLIITLLWQASAAALATYCSMGDAASGLATTIQDTAEQPGHEAMGHVDDEQHSNRDCCGADISENGCVMAGCAFPMQLLTQAVAAPGASDTRSTGIAFHPIAFPQALVFPFLRPPIV